MSGKNFTTIFLAIFGGVFLLVGLGFLASGIWANQESARVQSLPLLKAAQLVDTSPGTEALIEGKIAERNTVDELGFVAYTRSLYGGERCSTNNNDNRQECESIWYDAGYLKPPLWLDLPDGRILISNNDYEINSAPEEWLSTDGYVEDETYRYLGFKLNSPVFSAGQVITGPDGPAFKASYIYGGAYQDFVAEQQSLANIFFWGGVIFTLFGVAAVIAIIVVQIKMR